MHHNWFNVQFSRCILWISFSRNSVKSHSYLRFVSSAPVFMGLQSVSQSSIFHSQFSIRMVESTGIEPVTSCLQGRRSPSWANPPYRVNAECIMHNAELLAFILHSSFWILHLIRLKWWAKMDSNHRPHDYQSCALASWAIGPSCLHFSRAIPSKLNNVKYSSLCTDLRTLQTRNLSRLKSP